MTRIHEVTIVAYDRHVAAIVNDARDRALAIDQVKLTGGRTSITIAKGKVESGVAIYEFLSWLLKAMNDGLDAYIAGSEPSVYEKCAGCNGNIFLDTDLGLWRHRYLKTLRCNRPNVGDYHKPLSEVEEHPTLGKAPLVEGDFSNCEVMYKVVTDGHGGVWLLADVDQAVKVADDAFSEEHADDVERFADLVRDAIIGMG